ncbi:NAD(P)/FAD-dependent oxidoreductase [soil metagenome]
MGAGAAGLATAIFTRSRNPALSVLLLDGARRPGAKILVSGGSRCNVTNRVVTERDYWGGSSAVVRRVLRGFTVEETTAFFAGAGVTLHEEEHGKLFPDSNRSRDVLEALMRRAAETGVELRAAHRVASIKRGEDLFLVSTTAGEMAGRRVVLATGGQSLPKSGSDGAGYALSRALGHTIVSTTPALVPLVLDTIASDGLHRELSGVAVDAELAVWSEGAVLTRLRGALLWTHFGISGPVALDASRHWLRVRQEGRTPALTASFLPGRDFQGAERFWLDESRARPRTVIGTTLGRILPASMSSAVLERLAIDPETVLAHLGREERKRLAHALTAWPLQVSDSRGYNYAEATAGGVDLREVHPATLESRVCPGLYLVGEILDVDGRLGGFNFQWAWSSAAAAARALAAPRRSAGHTR